MKVKHDQLLAAGLVKPSRVIRVREQRNDRRTERRKDRKPVTARVNLVLEAA